MDRGRTVMKFWVDSTGTFLCDHHDMPRYESTYRQKVSSVSEDQVRCIFDLAPYWPPRYFCIDCEFGITGARIYA